MLVRYSSAHTGQHTAVRPLVACRADRSQVGALPAWVVKAPAVTCTGSIRTRGQHPVSCCTTLFNQLLFDSHPRTSSCCIQPAGGYTTPSRTARLRQGCGVALGSSLEPRSAPVLPVMSHPCPIACRTPCLSPRPFLTFPHLAFLLTHSLHQPFSSLLFNSPFPSFVVSPPRARPSPSLPSHACCTLPRCLVSPFYLSSDH